MTVKEFKKWLNDGNVPDNAKLAFFVNGTYQDTDDVDYDKNKNQVQVGYFN